ncbi:hypothetical protein GCM10023183_26210 [Nibribacter koreensis]|uniref:Uncharacterized protein n=1 Tax=Nibribacter koreensis TaxID=1084519 RepID=A0ABP8FQW8_9BACT
MFTKIIDSTVRPLKTSKDLNLTGPVGLEDVIGGVSRELVEVGTGRGKNMGMDKYVIAGQVLK